MKRSSESKALKNPLTRVLLLLKTPPPFGGGEIRAAALRDFVHDKPDFLVQQLNSPQRDKSNQGAFAVWKAGEFLRTWWRFAMLLRRARPALVYCSLSKSFLPFLRDSLLVWTARACGVAVAAELAGATFYFLGQGRLRTWYGRLMLRRLACLRVLGPGVAQTLAEYGITNTITTDNGIRGPGECPHEWPQPREKVRLLFVGTHSPQKGFDLLVEACEELTRRGYDFAVDTMGEWISPAFGKEMTARLEDDDLVRRFTFHGLKHGPEKWTVFQGAQVLVLPSMAEGQPLVILEAFACGMPVVASHVGAVPDTVQHGVNGFLVAPGDAADLCVALQNLLSDAELRGRMSQANFRLFQQRFTEDMFLARQVAWLRACAQGTLRPHGQVFGETANSK